MPQAGPGCISSASQTLSVAASGGLGSCGPGPNPGCPHPLLALGPGLWMEIAVCAVPGTARAQG